MMPKSGHSSKRFVQGKWDVLCAPIGGLLVETSIVSFIFQFSSSAPWPTLFRLPTDPIFQYDKDKNGIIDFQEFLALCIDLNSSDSEKAVAKLFVAVDKNSDK